MNKILFVGAGNMGAAVIARFAASPAAKRSRIFVVDPSVGTPTDDRFPRCATFGRLEELADGSEFRAIVLAVKPQVYPAISKQVGSLARGGCAVFSIIAGIDSRTLSAALPQTGSIIRCMPNIAAVSGAAVNVAFAASADAADKALFSEIFGCSGAVHWIEREDHMHAATVLSGSGPAIIAAFVEAMSAAAHHLGLEEQFAKDLAIDTTIGLAALLQAECDPAKWRYLTTSKAGVTEAVLNALSSDDALSELVSHAFTAGEKRSRYLGSASAS